MTEGLSCLHLSDVRGRANTSVRPQSLHPPAPGNSAAARLKTIRLLVLMRRWKDEAGSKKLVGKKRKGRRLRGTSNFMNPRANLGWFRHSELAGSSHGVPRTFRGSRLDRKSVG